MLKYNREKGIFNGIFYIPFFYPIILFFYAIPYLTFKHLLNKLKKFPYESISPLQIG